MKCELLVIALDCWFRLNVCCFVVSWVCVLVLNWPVFPLFEMCIVL